MTSSMVSVRGLHRDYGAGARRVSALSGVSFELARGTFTAVMGPSGSGKSTLLQCVAGLDRPTSGGVTVDDVDLAGLDETAMTIFRRDHIGFVFQAFNLITSLTAAQNVALPARLAGRRTVAAEITHALDAVGLTDREGHRPSELSGGQQQRVAIARAMFNEPAVLFADEPTGALDAGSSRRLLALLRTLVDDRGQTVLMVTHDAVAAAMADQVLFLADGRLADRMPAAAAEAIAARMTTLEMAS